jgi:hypothetical protein
MSTRKLDSGDKNLLRLIAKGTPDPEGWVAVSKAVYPLADKLPKELVELIPDGDEGRGKIRYTDEGRALMRAMEWL